MRDAWTVKYCQTNKKQSIHWLIETKLSKIGTILWFFNDDKPILLKFGPKNDFMHLKLMQNEILDNPLPKYLIVSKKTKEMI